MAVNPDFLACWQVHEGRAADCLRPRSGFANAAMEPEVFALFQQLIYAESGMWLHPAKAALIAGRLSERLRELGIATFKQYYRYLLHPQHADERGILLDRIAVEDEQFFREPRHFEFLTQRLFPRWQEEAAAQNRPHVVRAWSVGCGSGEEPFSLAMLLCEYFPPQTGWDIEVRGSDISRHALAKASSGLWPIQKAAEIPHVLLKRYMLKGTGEQSGWMKATPELARLVQFSRVNLMDPSSLAHGVFDLVFCRNVLTYFEDDARRVVVQNLCEHLSPRGFLFVSHREEIGDLNPRLKALIPSVYGEIGKNGRLRYDFRSR